MENSERKRVAYVFTCPVWTPDGRHPSVGEKASTRRRRGNIFLGLSALSSHSLSAKTASEAMDEERVPFCPLLLRHAPQKRGEVESLHLYLRRVGLARTDNFPHPGADSDTVIYAEITGSTYSVVAQNPLNHMKPKGRDSGCDLCVNVSRDFPTSHRI